MSEYFPFDFRRILPPALSRRDSTFSAQQTVPLPTRGSLGLRPPLLPATGKIIPSDDIPSVPRDGAALHRGINPAVFPTSWRARARAVHFATIYVCEPTDRISRVHRAPSHPPRLLILASKGPTRRTRVSNCRARRDEILAG